MSDSTKENPYDPPMKQGMSRSDKVVTESHTRSAIKALSWRIVATTTTMLIAFALTGKVGMALSIGGIEFVLKFFIYYAHERAWQLIPRGAIRRLMSRNR
jgi:uncharacterized membrane protein